MSAINYARDLETMLSTCLDTYSKDPVNLFLDGGEKFLGAAASKGRIFVVNDSASIRHPHIYDHGERSSYYAPDHLGVAAGTSENLPTSDNKLTANATELLSQTVYDMHAATRNINFPQSQPAGNLIDYVSNVVKANMSSILNEEECLFIRGEETGSGVEIRNDPAVGDQDFNVGRPTSLPAVLGTGTITAGHKFGGLSVTANGRWLPNTEIAITSADSGATYGNANASAGNGAPEDMWSDLQGAILTSSYSETERPTNVYTTLALFESYLSSFRSKAALPDPVSIDLGKEGTIPFGGITIDWSRYLDADVVWDFAAGSDTQAVPLLGINWNSLRLNVVRAGTPTGNTADLTGNIGFINQVSGLNPHPLTVTLFKRIEWKRQWSVDKGRRSFFALDGVSNTAMA